MRQRRQRAPFVSGNLVLLLFLTLGLVPGSSGMSTAQNKPVPRPGKYKGDLVPLQQVGTVLAPDGEPTYQLNLMQQEYINYLPKHMGGTIVRDTTHMVFYLTKTPLYGDQKGKVIWYVHLFNLLSSLRNWWQADVVWHQETRHAYVVIAESNGNIAYLRVYRVDTDQNIGPSPLALDPKTWLQWPKQATFLSELHILLPGGACGFSQLKVAAEADALFIVGRRQDAECGSSYFRFHLSSKKWTEEGLQEKALEPDNPPYVISIETK